MGILILKVIIIIFSQYSFNRNSTFYLLHKEGPELTLPLCEALFTSDFTEFPYMLK